MVERYLFEDGIRMVAFSYHMIATYLYAWYLVLFL